MMLKASSNKINPAVNMFLFTVRKNLGFTLVASVLALIMSPAYLINIIKNYTLNYLRDGAAYVMDDMMFAAVNVSAVAACGFFVILLFVNFSFLYKKSASDVFHSLPMTRNELLVSRFLGSYVSSLIPLVLIYIGFAITKVSTNSVLNDAYKIPVALLYTAIMMFVCGFFTMIFTVSAGSAFDGVVSFIGVNIGLIIIIVLISNLMTTHIFGYSGNDLAEVGVFYTSPFAYALTHLMAYMQQDTQDFKLFSFGSVLYVLLLCAACIWIVLMLYNRRKSEKAGEAFAFKFMPCIMGFIAAVICSYVLSGIFGFSSDDFGGILTCIIGAAIGSVIYNIITYRGFKKIKYALIIAGVAVAATFFANFAVNIDIFGIASRVPKAEKVKSISMNYRSVSGTVDGDEIADVVAFHNSIVSAYKDKKLDTSNNGDGNYNYVSLTYTLKDGSTMHRAYSIPSSVLTDEQLTVFNNVIPELVKSEFERCKSNNFELGITAYDYDCTLEISRNDAQKLIEAYCLDLKSLTAIPSRQTVNVTLSSRYDLEYVEKENESGNKSVYTQYNQYYQNININDNFKNTMAWVNSEKIQEMITEYINSQDEWDTKDQSEGAVDEIIYK